MVQAAAPSEFVLPGKPPSQVFFPLVVQPRPKRWKRLRTGGDEASPMELALPPEEDGTFCPVTVFDRIGIG